MLKKHDLSQNLSQKNCPATPATGQEQLNA
jgi:hypothetical protein